MTLILVLQFIPSDDLHLLTPTPPKHLPKKISLALILLQNCTQKSTLTCVDHLGRWLLGHWVSVESVVPRSCTLSHDRLEGDVTNSTLHCLHDLPVDCDAGTTVKNIRKTKIFSFWSNSGQRRAWAFQFLDQWKLSLFLTNLRPRFASFFSVSWDA